MTRKILGAVDEDADAAESVDGGLDQHCRGPRVSLAEPNDQPRRPDQIRLIGSRTPGSSAARRPRMMDGLYAVLTVDGNALSAECGRSLFPRVLWIGDTVPSRSRSSRSAGANAYGERFIARYARNASSDPDRRPPPSRAGPAHPHLVLQPPLAVSRDTFAMRLSSLSSLDQQKTAR